MSKRVYLLNTPDRKGAEAAGAGGVIYVDKFCNPMYVTTQKDVKTGQRGRGFITVEEDYEKSTVLAITKRTGCAQPLAEYFVEHCRSFSLYTDEEAALRQCSEINPDIVLIDVFGLNDPYGLVRRFKRVKKGVKNKQGVTQ